jgi:nucleoside phosphorylase
MSPKVTGNDPIDVAIITMRDDEFTAVLDRMATNSTIEGQRRYEVGTLTSARGRAITYSVARCVEQGPAEAQRLATYILEDLMPGLVVLCGIAGAMPTKDITLGDVVCATYVHDLSLRAARDRGGDTYRTRGAEMAPPILSVGEPASLGTKYWRLEDRRSDRLRKAQGARLVVEPIRRR